MVIYINVSTCLYNVHIYIHIYTNILHTYQYHMHIQDHIYIYTYIPIWPIEAPRTHAGQYGAACDKYYLPIWARANMIH